MRRTAVYLAILWLPAAAADDALPLHMHVFKQKPRPEVVSMAASEETPALHMTVIRDKRKPPKTVPESASPFLFRFGLNSGYRQDRLRWNIAADPSGEIPPNILSELKWKDVESIRLAGDAHIVTPVNVAVQARAAYSWIVDGKNRDSDYSENNRNGEYSRSINNADEGHTLDLSGGLGYAFTVLGSRRHPYLRLTPLGGYAYYEQSLHMTHGRQVIATEGLTPPPGRFPDLDSSYKAKWKGPWLGLRFESELGRFGLFGQAEYHWADYDAKADWNLRSELRHPVSFRHHADGWGIDAFWGGDWQLTDNLALEVRFDYRTWETDPGTDKTFFTDGTTIKTRLNEVTWKAFGANLGLQMIF
ncbi:hypothetical protein [Methylohalobius crimeensis]|uniref:hypothetical protein n=1 Tax=Methylohalobius crimeensis TaxID=244365 RepID=UPI0003B6A654|nr:hypothetical protein [Methylohalobius crimeensis]